MSDRPKTKFTFKDEDGYPSFELEYATLMSLIVVIVVLIVLSIFF